MQIRIQIQNQQIFYCGSGCSLTKILTNYLNEELKKTKRIAQQLKTMELVRVYLIFIFSRINLQFIGTYSRYRYQFLHLFCFFPSGSGLSLVLQRHVVGCSMVFIVSVVQMTVDIFYFL